MRRFAALALLLWFATTCASAAIVITPGDIGPSEPSVQILDSAGRLMTRPESWVYSGLSIPYPSELIGASGIRITIYFVPDAVTTGNVCFRLLHDTYNVGDSYNYGGFTLSAAPVTVGGSSSIVYSQVFTSDFMPPQAALFRIAIQRDFYSPAFDTYPTGVYIHAIEIEPAGTTAAGEGVEPPIKTLSAEPNPFRDRVTLHYTMDRPGSVSLKIFDVQGRLVDDVIRGAEAAGEHAVVWAPPRGAAPGVYFAYALVDGVPAMVRFIRLE